MEYVAAKMLFMLKRNPAADGRKLRGFSTSFGCAISRSDVVCLIPGIHSCVQQPKSHDGQTEKGYCRRETMSAEVWLKESQGYDVELRLAMKSCCTVRLIITILLTLQREILFCLR